MARDAFERRGYASTVPDAPGEAPRFGQVIETTKNAFLWELREFFNQASQTTEGLEERPRIEKYQFGFGAGLDPYETVVNIVRRHPDVLEALPHVAVLATSGAWRPLGFGPPLLGAVQDLPRVESGVEPYALVAGPSGRTGTIAVVGDGAMTLTVTGVGPFLVGHVGAQITFTGVVGRNAGAFVITALNSANEIVFWNEFGTAETLATLATWVIGDNASVELHVRTTPDGFNAKVDRVVFRPVDFPTAAPITAASATDVVRVYNNRALYSHAETHTSETGVRILAGGPAGGYGAPNQVEVASGTTTSLLTALTLGRTGTGDSMTVSGSTVTLTDAGAAFVAADVGRYITIAGSDLASNNGRFLVTARAATTVSFTNGDGQAEASFTGTWFIGLRDDTTNVLRPAKNRYAYTWDLQIEIQVLTEDENIRTELADLVGSFFSFWLEQRHFQLLGRSVLDDTVADEHYQIVIKPGVRSGQETEVPRAEDPRDKIYVAAFSVDVTTTMYLDRDVEHPSVPDVPWTVKGSDLRRDETLPFNTADAEEADV